jgi:hypothetical protein
MACRVCDRSDGDGVCPDCRREGWDEVLHNGRLVVALNEEPLTEEDCPQELPAAA